MAGPTRGRLEGRITVPTGGWTATVGGGTATIVAGSYYAKTLLTAVGTAFASAASTTCTAVGSHGEAGTGLVTITFGSAKAIVWVSTDLRDILGFATDSASATSHVGTMQMRGVWLPNCAYKAPNGIGAWRGWRESDFRSAENAAGYVFAHMGQEKEVTELSWHAVERARVWTANETSDNTSWERFHRDCLWGVASWGTAGGPVRFYPDAADSATYVVYKVPDASMIKPQPFYADWAGGPWTVSLPRLVADPTDTSGAPRVSMVPANLATSSDSTDGTSFATASITATAGVPIYISVTGCRSSSAVGQSPSGIAGAGLTFTKVAEVMFSEVIQARDLSVWRAMPASTASGAITITYANTHTAVVWSVVQVSGADTSGTNASGSVVQFKTGASATSQTTLAVALDNAISHPSNVTLAAFASITNNTFTAGSGFTIIAQDLETLASCAIVTEYLVNSVSANITVDTGGVTTLGGIVIEIKAGLA